MKTIVGGKSYNTETATKVVGGDNYEYSEAWWGLYQTRHGAFFKVVVDHDGETILKFGPVTDDEALDTVQKHAPHLVDQYFGPFPEGGAAERRMTIRIPENLAERIERAAEAAEAKSLSLNSYAMRCFERCVAADGHPKQEGMSATIEASGVDTMALPEISEKTMPGSYQRSRVVAEGTALSSGAKQATVAFPPSTFDKLKLAADKNGVSLSEMVRQCVNTVLSGKGARSQSLLRDV